MILLGSLRFSAVQVSFWLPLMLRINDPEFSLIWMSSILLELEEDPAAARCEEHPSQNRDIRMQVKSRIDILSILLKETERSVSLILGILGNLVPLLAGLGILDQAKSIRENTILLQG